MNALVDNEGAARVRLREHLAAALTLADEHDVRAAAHIAMAIDAIDADQDSDAQSSVR
jgi:hypothetical protein